MKLNMLERLKVLQMLPETGTFITLNIIQKLKDSLAPTEKELKDFEVVEKDGNISWNKKGTEEVDIEIGEKATDVVVEALKKLDSEEKLTPQHISIYEKFVKNKD